VVYATLVVEDVIQEAVALKVVSAEKIPMAIHRTIGLHGTGFIDTNISRFARASSFGLYVVIRDLDRNECPPALVRQLLGGHLPAGLLFAVAVREVEAWLMADGASFRRFFSVGKVEDSPESIEEPKERVISLARKSHKRGIREGVAPKGSAKVGELYDTFLLDYIKNHWQVGLARRKSPSLQRFVERLSAMCGSG